MAGYGTPEGFSAWLAAHGYELSDELDEAVLRQRGSSFIDAVYGPDFPGTPTGGIAQDRLWPRTGATAYGADIASNAVPVAVEQASYVAAYYEDTKPGALAVITTPAAQVKRQKVDVLEVEYFAGGSAGSALQSATPTLLLVEGLLAPLLTGGELTGGPFVV